MTRTRTRLAAAAATVGFAALGVVAGAGPAAASVIVPPDWTFARAVAAPSSVIGSLDGVDAATRARLVGNTVSRTTSVWKVPVSWGNITKVAGTGGATASPLAVGVGGFLLGFEGANTVMRFVGVPSEDVGIDGLGQIFGWTPTPDPVFVPNADVGPAAPGWVGGDNVLLARTKAFVPQGEGCHNSVGTEYIGNHAFYVDAAGGMWGDLTPGRIGADPIAFDCSSYVTGFSADYLDPVSGNWRAAIFSAVLVAGPGELVAWRYRASGGAPVVVAPIRFTSTVGTDEIMWYPEGHPDRPQDVDPDPERAWETRWTCSSGPGGVARSATFRESDTSWPGFPEASCPDGAMLALVEVWEVTIDGSVEDALIQSWTPTQGQQDWADEWPECLDGSCRLELYRVDPTAPGQRVSCLGNPAACLDWYYDVNKADKYECQYAGAVIALDECRVYGPTFNVVTNTPVQTDDGTTRRPDETQVHGDPATGEPQPKPEGSPETTPAPEGCPPPFEFTLGGFGYWVTKGGICAIQATFVPPPGLIASEVDATIDVVRTRPPWTLLGPVTGTIGGLADGWTTGCMLLPDADPYGNGLRIPCDPPSSDWMTALKAISVVAVVAGTAFGVWHMLVGAIGGGKVND